MLVGCFEGSGIGRGRGIHPQYFEKELNEPIEAAFKTLLIDLKRLGTQPFVVFIPTKEACYNEAYAKLFPEDEGYTKMEADAFKSLWSIASKEGVPFLDLTPAFRERSRSEQLYFDFDGHWNAAGHKYAAELMLQAFWNTTIGEA